jgi:hypothetical protein
MFDVHRGTEREAVELSFAMSTANDFCEEKK